MDLILPKRIKNRLSELTEMQMAFLDCYILRIYDPKELFQQLFAVGISPSRANAQLNAFMRNSDVINYLKTRTAQLEEHFFGESEESEDKDAFDGSKIKSVIMKKISNDLVQSIEDGTLDYKQGAIVEKFMNKVLDFDDSEKEQLEPPRIYLPENCLNCRYRVAIEETDDTIDECKYCEYRNRCIEQGIEYDYKTQLNIDRENGN